MFLVNFDRTRHQRIDFRSKKTEYQIKRNSYKLKFL